MDNRARVVQLDEGRKHGVNRQASLEEHQRVLACCSDVPEEFPSFQLPLPEVGIGGKTTWVLLPQGRLPFAVAMHVDLPAHRRGIHMSRLEEVMVSLCDRKFVDLRHYALELGREMMARQDASNGKVKLSGKLPVLRETSASGRLSLDPMEISAEVALSREGSAMDAAVMIGVALHHITACPCTQAYNRELFGPDGCSCPLPTHSQRSCTRLALSADKTAPGYEDLAACLEAALHVTQDLLKRPDEAEIVLKAHRRPQFAEDAVRETAREVGLRFGAVLSPSARVLIESLSLESIHIHDVHCRLETSLDEIVKRLPRPDDEKS